MYCEEKEKKKKKVFMMPCLVNVSHSTHETAAPRHTMVNTFGDYSWASEDVLANIQVVRKVKWKWKIQRLQ